MRTRRFFPWLVAATAALSACGGGGSGSSPAPPATLSLTDANASVAATFALSGAEESIIAAEYVGSLTLELLHSGKTAENLTCSAFGGAGTMQYVDNDRNGGMTSGDSVSLQLPTCSGYTMSGRLELTSISSNNLSGTVTFESRRDSVGKALKGSFTLSLDLGADEADVVVTNATFDFTSGGTTEKITLSRAAEALTRTNGYSDTFAGHVDSARLGGGFDFSTTVPLDGTNGSFPRTGEITLTAGASKARFTPPTANGSRVGEFRVDPAGNGYGGPQTVDWSTLLVGWLFRWQRNDPPVITRLDLTPPSPTIADDLTAVYSATDPEGLPVYSQFEWRVNGVLLSNGLFGTYPAGTWHKGDVVEVTLIVTDGQNTSKATASVTIGNSAPQVSGFITFSPSAPTAADEIAVVAPTTDGDGDALSYTYAWRVNGTVLPGRTAGVLPAGVHHRGDTVTAVVTANDGTASASTEISAVIGDAPPHVTAVSPPASAPYGVPLTFATNVSDADGDSVSGLKFRLVYGPAGMTVNATTGLVSWQPQGPMFDHTQQVQWAVTVDAPDVVMARGTISVVDTSRKYPIMRTGFDGPVSPFAMKVGDFDSDGHAEALILSARGLYELASDGAGGYRQSWMYPFAFTERDSNTTPDGTSFTTGDVDHDGRAEIFIGSQGHIWKLDGVDRRAVASAAIGDDEVCNSMAYGDLDRDGNGEIVCLTKRHWPEDLENLIVLRASDLSIRWRTTVPQRYGASVAVGNVDSDPALEIVTAGGYVIDGASFAVEWQYTTSLLDDYGFGFDVHTADLDGDGVEEIVAPFDWHAGFVAYDARMQRVRFQATGTDNIGAIAIGDLDGDGKPEIVVATRQFGTVKAYKVVGNNPQVLFTLDNQLGETGVAIGDLDRDGAAEVIWASYTAPQLQVGGRRPSFEVEWSSETPAEIQGPFLGGELAGTSVRPRSPLFASMRNPMEPFGTPVRLISMNAQTGDLKLGDAIGENLNGAAGLAVSDYDADGTDEAFFTAGNYYASSLIGRDTFTNTTEWSTPENPDASAYGVALDMADLTGDHRDELVAISAAGFVDVYDVFHNNLVWHSPPLQSTGRGVVAADLDGDGTLDLIAAADLGLHVFKRAASGPDAYIQTSTYVAPDNFYLRGVAVADTDGDGEREVIALLVDTFGFGHTSLVERLDRNLHVLSSFTVPWASQALLVEPSSSPLKNLLLATGSAAGASSRLVAVNAVTGDEVWRSPLFGSAPSPNSVHYVTLPGATDAQMTMGAQFGVYLTR